MEELKQRFPDGVDYSIVYDTTPFIKESISEVFITLRRRRAAGGLRRALVPAELAFGDDSAGGRAGGRDRHLRRDGGHGFQPQQPHAFRPGAGHRHRRGRRHRGGRGRGTPHRDRPAAQGGHDQGHEPGLRAGDRRGPGPQRGVRALRVHQRHHGAVLPPVRPDDRRVDGDLGLQFADAQPGPLGPAAAAPGTGAGTSGVLPIVVYPFLLGGAGLSLPDCPGPRGLRRDGLARLEPAGRRLRARLAVAVAVAGAMVWLPSARPLDRVLAFLFRRFNVGFTWATEALRRPGGHVLAGQPPGALGLRRPAVPDLLGLHELARRASFPCRTRATCW